MPRAARIAYIVGFYPTVSHTFITREVDGLRARGLEVATFSLRRTPAAGLLTEADRRAAAETTVVLPPAPGALLAAHLRALATRPGTYGRVLRLALSMGTGAPRALLWQLFYFGEGVLVWHALRRRGIAHLHAHFANAASAVALLAAELGRADGITWSFTMHGPTELDDVTRYALAEKVRRADWVAVISDYARSQLMKLVEPEHWEKLAIVHCGVDPARFTPADRAGRAERAPGAPLRVLCLGRLVPDKGQALLLDAVARLGERGVPVALTLAGDGPSRAALEAEAARRDLPVTFLGAVGQDRVPGLYAEADAFCLPSFAEGVPVVLMEAMATELPVVCTRIAGVAELVEDGVGGLVVAPGRADVLADALERLAADPGLRAALGRAGRGRVLAGYDIAGEVARLAERFTGHPPATALPRRSRLRTALANRRARNGKPSSR